MLKYTLDSAKISEILSIYKPEHIYLKSAEVLDMRITGIFRKSIYPYTKEDLFQYITGTTAVLYLAQLSYVFSAVLIEHRVFEATKDISYEDFLVLRDKTQTYFTTLNLKFNKPIANSDNLSVVMEVTGVKNIRNAIIADINFNFQNCIVGHLQLVMVL